MRESEIEKYLVEHVKALGGEVRKVRWINRKGAPDRLVMLPWVTAWVELKCTNGIVEPHQQREHKRMRKLGQFVVVAFSKKCIDDLLLQ